MRGSAMSSPRRTLRSTLKSTLRPHPAKGLYGCALLCALRYSLCCTLRYCTMRAARYSLTMHPTMHPAVCKVRFILRCLQQHTSTLQATTFDQQLGSWDVGRVTSMRDMFNVASNFDQPIDAWDVSKTTSMYNMFSQASKFNQPLGSWAVGRVVSMGPMFYEAYAFNQMIGTWSTGQVTDFPNGPPDAVPDPVLVSCSVRSRTFGRCSKKRLCSISRSRGTQAKQQACMVCSTRCAVVPKGRGMTVAPPCTS